ncbi:hypothetical protein BJ875DRAFT_448827 [Amylocarpus encephaloides]|uniref:Uncharacterized protein n=1 Tax=Amylocarpus encephaloides TaxID=45428 RepID=A0A9P7YT39_9HELO|nr:hypothetical protein BJ875DRAFT_448827 [Amylocarpus encephaloides]
MGEFHEAVSALLGFFTEGLSNIRALKEHRTGLRSSASTSEVRLTKSLKKNRNEVKSAYDRDLERFGAKFADGDVEAKSSLAIILARLAAGVLNVVSRLSKGKSTASDYQTLLSLSDVTRAETIKTFERLSNRISTSSLALMPTKQEQSAVKRNQRRTGSSTSKSSHVRASAPNLSPTPFGMATASGWVRPKPHKNRPSASRSASSSKTPRKQPSPEPPQRPQELTNSPPPQRKPRGSPRAIEENGNRNSYMSFASDSTKLGEIPEHKWAGNNNGMGMYPITPRYPLDYYRAPLKPKSRLMKLFGRS